jgi:protein-tyrosine phosphatase
MIRILFVCLGNICRSPLAEAIFVHQLTLLGKQGLCCADSCGTSNYHIGSPPDPRTMANALKNGVLIEHKARQFCVDDFDTYDLILAMDKSNVQNILKLSSKPNHAAKVALLRRYNENKPDAEVPDPYYGDESDFQEVFDILWLSMQNLIAKEVNPSPTVEG